MTYGHQSQVASKNSVMLLQGLHLHTSCTKRMVSDEPEFGVHPALLQLFAFENECVYIQSLK
jgi:hypothetical protein